MEKKAIQVSQVSILYDLTTCKVPDLLQTLPLITLKNKGQVGETL